MTGKAQDRPFTLLIAALGGEGGGLLTDWIVEACRHEGVLVQSTSIPGVAQRTGATTYYLEAMRPRPTPTASPCSGFIPRPAISMSPSPPSWSRPAAWSKRAS